MNKHTPGPWAQCNLAIYAAQDGETVANCAGNKELHRSFSDAKLIAAAPELLEACIAALNSDAQIEGVDCTLPKWLKEQLQSAIAKATGEA